MSLKSIFKKKEEAPTMESLLSELKKEQPDLGKTVRQMEQLYDVSIDRLAGSQVKLQTNLLLCHAYQTMIYDLGNNLAMYKCNKHNIAASAADSGDKIGSIINSSTEPERAIQMALNYLEGEKSRCEDVVIEESRNSTKYGSIVENLGRSIRHYDRQNERTNRILKQMEYDNKAVKERILKAIDEGQKYATELKAVDEEQKYATKLFGDQE